MRRLPISNRKLYRLGVGVIISIVFFLAYLVYVDVHPAQMEDGAKYDLADNIDTVFRGQNSGHDHRPRDSRYPVLDIGTLKTNRLHDTIPKLNDYTSPKATFKVSTPTAHHSSHTRQSISSRRSLQTSPIVPKSHRNHIFNNASASAYSASNKIVLGIHSPNEATMDSTNGEIDDEMYLIYLCDPLTWCGGWGDRQRGMTSVHFLSRAVGRKFKILMTTPCHLSKFYRPHKVNWLWDDHSVTNTSFIINDIFSKSDFRSLLSNGDFNSLYPSKVVYVKTNHDYQSILLRNPHYTDWVRRQKFSFTKKGRFRGAWTDMMQPSHYLLQRLQNVVGTDVLIRKGLLQSHHLRPTQMDVGRKSAMKKRVSSSTLICAHVRMGRNPTIPMDEDFDSIKPEDIPKLLNFLLFKDTIGNARYFVATDFEGVRTEFRKFFGDSLIDYGGKILHIDRQRRERNACVGFEVALLDQLILSVCDILVVSRSGFSIHAAYVSNRTEPLYIMEDGKISTFTL